MKALIGIDIGTSCTKSVLFDTNGSVIAAASYEYPMHQPQNGFAEADPADWWRAVCITLRQVTETGRGSEIVGIGLSGQMHSLVMLDEKDRVLRPAILWCDQRTADECAEIEALVGKERLIDIMANPALTGFTASKLMWVKKHEPEIFRKCKHVLLAKDYIRLMLTGEYATDVSDASGMQLLDVKKRCWSREVCDLLGIPMHWLASVRESCEISGYIHARAAAETGLSAGIPVAAGGGDNACAAIGTGVCRDGEAFTTIGTSGVVFAHTKSPIIDPKGRIHTFCAAVPQEWHVMGVTQAAGLSLSWLRNHFIGNDSYAEIDRQCEQIPIGSEALLYLPYLMGERTPILDPDVRGVFFGLSAVHTKYHAARAVMEGVSFSLRNALDVLRELEIAPDNMRICGGGSKSVFWKAMLADVYRMPVITMHSDEGAALGAAILGGCAAGVYTSVSEGCKRATAQKVCVVPNAERAAAYEKSYALYNQLYPCLKECFQELKKMRGGI